MGTEVIFCSPHHNKQGIKPVCLVRAALVINSTYSGRGFIIFNFRTNLGILLFFKINFQIFPEGFQ